MCIIHILLHRLNVYTLSLPLSLGEGIFSLFLQPILSESDGSGGQRRTGTPFGSGRLTRTLLWSGDGVGVGVGSRRSADRASRQLWRTYCEIVGTWHTAAELFAGMIFIGEERAALLTMEKLCPS